MIAPSRATVAATIELLACIRYKAVRDTSTPEYLCHKLIGSVGISGRKFSFVDVSKF